MNAPARKPRSPRQTLVFSLIMVMLPLLLLALIEALLRLVGYGQDYRLFVEDPRDENYWVMNPYAGEKFFMAQENATIGNAEPFLKQKPSDTYRLFVLGASTAVGYPYLHNGSFHRWLQYRLMHTFPEKNFEIINVSLTAVSTYTVRDFAKTLVDYQPDAVLIYAGHNEYYGALGVGSTSNLGQNPALVHLILYLRDFRLMQLITHAVTRLKASFSPDIDLGENLMKRMAAQQAIPYPSELYESGLHQFEVNIRDVLETFQAHEVPVLISSLASNEKDLPPFISDTTAEAASAIHHYQLGQQTYAQQDFQEAKQQYQAAKELDLLRFRAPEKINEIIRTLAEQYDQVHLVEGRTVLANHSPHGILGQETLLEHVHPNLYGYALLSEAFYQAMKRKKMVAPVWKDTLSFAALRQQMPITAVDSLKGAYEIMILKEGWPFNQPMPPETATEKTLEEKLAGALVVRQISWGEAMNQLLNHYLTIKDQRRTLLVTEALILEYPYQTSLWQQAGKLSMNLNRNERAVFYLKKAFAQQKDQDTAQKLMITLLKLDRPQEALPYLDWLATTQPRLVELKKFVGQVIALKAVYAQDTTNVTLTNNLAQAYLRFANTEAAAKYVRQSLALAPDNEEARQLQQQIEAIKRK